MFHVKLIAIVYILNCIKYSDGQKYFPHVGFDYHVLDPIKAIKNYCPDYISCYERRLNDGKNHTHLELLKPGNGTCCIPCQCDDLCFHRGDCCYDKQLEQEHVDRSHIHVYRSGKENLTCWRAHTSDHFTDSQFLLLQDCVATDTDSSVTGLRDKCLNPSWDNIEENTPVYSKIDGGHYRNIFCAKCSNVVHDCVPWTVMVSCFNDIEASQLTSVRNGSGL
ncbi:hypothetical protein DPMN_191080 [Dreissena polymorpha]|uniref:Uncharacterized protein n=1 Tax=Dreissena polymorpha TaxID=45954 RepID=A0A9D4BD50_DREPO|nr:hypothetical protein DPMN_191080 [Dreissena polymorpha]